VASPPPTPRLSPDGKYYWDGQSWQSVRFEAPRWTTAVSIGLILVPAGIFMFLATTFLFHFSSGQDRMGPVVNYGALAVVAGTSLLAVVTWRIRSPAAALKWTAIATPVAWVAAALVEWVLSFSLGAG
jgi:hypothetical protein